MSRVWRIGLDVPSDSPQEVFGRGVQPINVGELVAIVVVVLQGDGLEVQVVGGEAEPLTCPRDCVFLIQQENGDIYESRQFAIIVCQLP